MVKIKETGPDMFWGLTLEAGRKYSQTVEASFHVSMAAVEPKGNDVVSVYVSHNDHDFLLCSLKPSVVFQQTLDLGFIMGETITFYTTGKGTVHLTGYRVFDEDDDDDDEDFLMDDDEEEEESSDLSGSDDDQVTIPAKKQKLAALPAAAGKKKLALDEVDDEDDSDEDEDDMDDDDDDLDGFLDDEAEDDEDEDSEDEEEDSNEEDEELSEELVKEIAEKVQKKMEQEEKKKKSQTPEKKGTQTPQANGKTPQQKGEKTPKQQKQQITPQQQKQPNTPQQQKQQKTPQQQAKKTPQQQGKQEPVKTPNQPKEATPQKRKLPSGVVVEDLKVGHGPEAKTSKMAHVYYTGKLTNGKVFDSNTSGKPFKFRLGKNEVIKGWDLGLQGMKVGGKRRLTIPPNLAYGNDKSSGLPPNSTLHFDVELRAVS